MLGAVNRFEVAARAARSRWRRGTTDLDELRKSRRRGAVVESACVSVTSHPLHVGSGDARDEPGRGGDVVEATPMDDARAAVAESAAQAETRTRTRAAAGCRPTLRFAARPSARPLRGRASDRQARRGSGACGSGRTGRWDDGCLTSLGVRAKPLRSNSNVIAPPCVLEGLSIRTTSGSELRA